MAQAEIKLWQLRLGCADAEEEGWRLTEHGIAGFEIKSADEIVCFWSGAEPQLSGFLDELQAAGFACRAAQPAAKINWVQRCRELWQPVSIGGLRIVPVLDESQAAAPGPHEIFILPALGFGTGHHATTAMMIELLQHPAVYAARPQSCLDAGTGSCILALAAARLHALRADAFDCDPLAIENARANLRLNHGADQARLAVMDLSAAAGGYDLVLANLYAELLCVHAGKLSALTKQHGLLVLSGILSAAREEVLRQYAPPGWVLLSEKAQHGWCALLLRAQQAAI